MLQKFPQVSFVISTRNRCHVLLETLTRLSVCGLERSEFDIHVVDNASTDGTSARVRDTFPKVKLLTLNENKGSVAKNEALDYALGKYIVFLDDDSYPAPGAIQKMIRHFEADGKLGAATFTITLPNGQRECSAYPNVFIGCGVGLRRRALRAVGGLPDDFFMQAEEYDLSMRLLDAGYKVETFDDLHVTHLKTPQARVSARTMRLDVRNNLFLITRRFPLKWVLPMGWDWMKRYWWIASSKNATGAFFYGVIDFMLRSVTGLKRDAVSDEGFERFAKVDEIRQRLECARFTPSSGTSGESWGDALSVDGRSNASDPHPNPLPEYRERGQMRVVLVDCGKNIHAYWRACRDLGIEIVAIADRSLHHPARRYRGIRIVDDATARSLRYDAVIISNLSPVHAAVRRDQWRMAQDRAVIDLFEPNEPISDERPAESESRRIAVRSA